MRRWSYARTDIGRKRPHNEDSFLADDTLGLYAVADGVGGHAKGEVASQEAVEQLFNWVKGEEALLAEYLSQPDEEHIMKLRRLVESAVQSACYMLYGMAELEPEQRGMSTTISALLLCGNVGIVGQVGDSRVYRLREGVIEQLTEDHTLLNYKLKHGLISPEQAARAPGKNVITRAVGHKEYVEVDTLHVDVEPGDRFLLCSDGLHGYFDNNELRDLMAKEPASAVDEMIDLANNRGGKDNITVVLVLVL